MNRIFLIFILFPVALACNSSKRTIEVSVAQKPGVDFLEGKLFSDVVEIAKVENKVVFIDFVADWCLPCKIMDEQVYSDKSISDYFNEHFINFKVDIDEEIGANIAAIYQVSALPTMIFVDTIGRTLVRIEGAVFHRDLLLYANNANTKYANAE